MQQSMETQLIVRIDKNTKQRFSRLVGDLWDKAARKLKKKEYTERDVEDAIRKARASE